MNELKEELTVLKERREELENCDNIEEYNEALDSEGMIMVCGYEYYPSDLLSSTDPIAYSCGHNDYNDSLLTDINEEITEKEMEIKDFE